MVGHIISFYGEIWLIIPKISLLPLLIWSTETFDLDEVTHTCRIPVGWFSGSDVRTKSFFSPP